MRKIVTLFILLFFSAIAGAGYKAGVEYELLANVQSAPTDGKVQVIEFFSYGCPHCYNFEPHIEKWLESKPDNIEFVRIPAVFSKNWEVLASLYYAAEVLGVQEKMHPVIFDAMHSKGKKVRSFDDLKAVFVANGVSGEKLEKAMNSFTVAAKTRRAKTMTQSYGIKSVPNIVVQGKYRTDGTLAKGYNNIFKVIEYLANQETGSKNSLSQK